MSFPAHQILMDQVPQRNTHVDHLKETIRAKYESLKIQGEPKFMFAKNHTPKNQLKYDDLFLKLKNYLNQTEVSQNTSIEQFMPIIYGNLQGSFESNEPMDILVERFGEGMEKLKLEEILSKNLKIVNYGIGKKKTNMIRQVEKKALQSLEDIYDVKQIKSHRKTCGIIRNYLKAYKKFIQSYEKNINNESSEENQLIKSYVDFMKEQMTFQATKINLQKMELAMEEQIIKNQKKVCQKEEIFITPLKQMSMAPSNIQVTQKCQKSKIQVEMNKQGQSKQAKHRVRKTKQEVEREKQIKQQEKLAKQKEKQQKQQQRLLKQQERKQKQRQKQLQRQAKQRQKEQKERQRKAKIEQKQREKQRQREAKQAERKKKEQQKQKKTYKGQSITKFFSLKSDKLKDSPVKVIEAQIVQNNESQSVKQTQFDTLIESILNCNTSIETCRSQFFNNEMKAERPSFEPYYVNIFCHKSRLEFSNYFVSEEKCKLYHQPHDQHQFGKYDDSSVQYEDLCGDQCSEEDAMSVEQAEEEASENSAIVSDHFFEEGELSSVDSDKEGVEIHLDKGRQWHLEYPSVYLQKYEMYCLEDEKFPLPMATNQTNEAPILLKCQLYKQIHGFYGAKDILVKKLANIAQKLPKSYFDNLIKQTTTKKACQRLVKPEIIQYLNDQKEGFSKELEEVKQMRDQQYLSEAREKVNQKEKEMERLILQEAGTYYIIDLLQFLRQKGYRMRKVDLTTFIDGRIGPHWDDIRRRMKKMQVKEKDKIDNFVIKKKTKQANQQMEQEQPQGQQKANEPIKTTQGQMNGEPILQQ